MTKITRCGFPVETGLYIRFGDDDDVLEKPFSESELIDAVASLLYWHRPRRTP